MRISSKIIAILIAAVFLFPSAGLCLSEDGYEPDDVALKATVIATDGAWQHHTIFPAKDDDWMKFDAEAGTVYIIETGALDGCDTYIYLYDTDRVTRIAQDDERGSEAKASLIEFRCRETGTYYIYVRDFWLSGTGAYSISVRESGTGIIPDAYEPDNDYKNASLINVDSAQFHTISPDDTSDWYYFEAWEGNQYLIVTTDSSGELAPYTHLYLYEYNGAILVMDGPGSNGLTWICEKSNRYYVEVAGDGSATDTYSFIVAKNPAMGDDGRSDHHSAEGCFIRTLSW